MCAPRLCRGDSRMPTVAVIHTHAPAHGAPGPGPVDALARHWPRAQGSCPEFATVDPDEALRLAAPASAPAWEACILLLGAPAGAKAPEGRALRLLDALQQALVPGLVLHAPGPNPLGDMSLDGLIA